MDKYKLAKWTIVSVVPYILNRQKDFFIKPTTTKNIIDFLELNDLKYNSKPTYTFYKEYSNKLEDMKIKVDKSLTFDNAAFTGFLRVAIELCKSEV